MTQPPPDHAQDRDELAAGWCVALASGELSYEEEREFDQWMAAPDNAAALYEAIRLWHGAQLAADLPEVIRARSSALQSYRRAHGRRWANRVTPTWKAWGALAAVLLVAIISFALLYQPMQVYSSGIGERRVAMLDDGSTISLDADSEVDVRLSDNRRALFLVRGRAKFDVARDPLRPFSVTVGDKVVVATGTSFSVERLQKSAHVLLYEGHVAVVNQADRQPVRRREGGAADMVLTPGRELVVPLNVRDATATVSPFDPAQSLYWEAGQLSFENEPLALAIERVNRYSTVKVMIGDPAIASAPVNGVFEASNAEAFVEAVTAFNDVTATRAPGAITLRRGALPAPIGTSPATR